MNTNNGSPSRPNSLTLQTLTQTMAELQQEPAPIAFTCTPAFYAAIQAKMRTAANSRYPESPHASSAVADVFMLNVYSVPNQTEDCLAFYDRNLLRTYLATMEAAQPAATPAAPEMR